MCPFALAARAAISHCMSSSRSRLRTARKAPASLPPPPAPPTLPQGSPTSFARALWRVASADVSAGNAVTLFDDGAKTFDAMVAMIEEARHSVLLESYILRADTVGQRFAAALGAAAHRGVHVRLLSDWIGRRGTPESFLDGMRTAGVDVRVFSPPGWRRWLGLVPRDHRKLLVTDGATGLTGGIGS